VGSAVPGHIRVSCANQVFDFIRSEDFEVEKLQYAVALLMQCEPRDLSILASDGNLHMASESLVPILASMLSDTTYVQFGITHSTDVEMEDA
jgi:hypothetical protein